MKSYQINELYISIVFFGMLLGVVIADILTFYPTGIITNNYINVSQVLGIVFFVGISVYLFLKIHKKRNTQNLFAIINNTENLIWSIDKRFRYLAFNHAYENKHEELFGKSVKIGELIWNNKLTIDQMLQWKQFFQRGLNGEKFTADIDYSLQAGEPLYVTISFNPIYDSENQVAGVGCFLQNITQRLLHEEKINQQNNQFKEIAFIISHTVRAPLSNILGLVEVLDKDNPLNEVNKQIMDYIKVSAKQLDDVVRNVVDRTGKIKFEDS